MDDNESFEALEVENTRPNEEEEEEEEESESDEKHDEEEEKEQKQATVVQSSESMLGELQSEAEFRESNLETLDVPCSYVSLAKDQYTGVQVSSTAKSVVGVQLEQISSPEQEVMAAEEVRVGLAQTQSQLQDSVCPNLLSELSPTSVTQSFSSAPSPTVPEQRLSPSKVNIVCTPKQDQQNPSSLKTLYAVSIPKTSSDGYNWRKYGQKQVKSPTGSRSYYRCTYSECCAKKIECCDHSGHVIDIVYKSQHSHDPPRKVSSTRGSKVTLSGEPALENSVLEQPIRIPNSDASPSSKVPMQETPSIPERKQQNLYDPHKNGKIKAEEEHTDEPDPKRRVKKSELTYPASDVKPGKKAKFVVHAAGDVGISGDGYRWRKYGQKMVKGNPHPRNYYRCTSAGCPVRKHIETAVDNSSAVIITYKGVHDHDMPVPKKRHGPPSAPLVAATAPTSMNNLQLKNDAVQNQIPSTKWSVDTEGELTGEALDLGGEKAMESARTLLSIGFEIKPC